jgi:ankyrin repeat protein
MKRLDCLFPWKKRASHQAEKQRAKDLAKRASSALDRAITTENYIACFQLIEQDIGLDYRDTLDNTILHTAAIKRSFLIPILLRKGLDPNAVNEAKETPLHVAVSCNFGMRYDESQFAALAELQFADDDLRQVRDQVLGRNISPEDCIELLLKNGSNVHARLFDWKDPLIVAVRHEAPLSVIKVLLCYGAHPWREDIGKRHALSWAKYIGYLPCVDYFERYLLFFDLLAAALTHAGRKSSLRKFPTDLLRALDRYLFR